MCNNQKTISKANFKTLTEKNQTATVTFIQRNEGLLHKKSLSNINFNRFDEKSCSRFFPFTWIAFS